MYPINWKNEILTVPNMLSLLRLLLIPVYVVIYLNAASAEHFYLSAGILAFSCMTDLIDGKIARRFNMITTVGKILDPIADKATQFSLILCLTVRYPVLTYLVIPFVIKESFQLIAGSCALKKGMMLSGALFAGKICTVVLFISLILLVMLPSLPDRIVAAITCADGFFLLLSFVQYFFAYFGKHRKTHNIIQGE